MGESLLARLCQSQLESRLEKGIPSRTGRATTLMLHPRVVQVRIVAAPAHLVTVFELL